MSPRSKKEYIEITSLRYTKAPRKKKSAILDEFCATCKCHRKHAIRVLRGFKRFIKHKIKKRGRNPLLISVLLYAIHIGYDQTWTGFQGYTNNKGEFVPPKKLWDWLQLLIVPLLIAVGVWWLNKSQKKSEQQIETDRQRQKTLEDYFDCMTNLLLKEHLRDGVIIWG